MLDDLENSLRLFYRLSPGPSIGLDRAFGKFSSLSEALDELGTATQSLRHELDAYCRGKGPSTFGAAADFDREAAKQDPASPSCSSTPVQPSRTVSGSQSKGSTAMPVDPDRIQFKHAPTFSPEQFINDPLLKAGFLDPKLIRTPESTWPKVRPARVMCSRDDLLKLFKKRDDVHCFKLLEASQSEYKYRCGLFAVYKSTEKDRQIFNPIPENGRTLSLNSSTITLAHGSLLCNLFLDQHEDLVMGADDLEDFYHCFQVPPEHADRNHVHGVFPAETFSSFNAWDPKFAGKMVVGCFSTLAMGTSYAVELAQHSHTNLLQRAGVLREDMQVCYRKPLPRSPVLVMLCIDDLAVLQKVPRGLCGNSEAVQREDRRLLSLAGQAYRDAGLRVSEKKSIRDSFQTTILGAEIDGRRGLVSAPRLRILMLAKLTLQLVQLGWTSKHLLETIIGCWIFVLMFRRPLLSLLNDVFHEGAHCYNRFDYFQMTTGAKQELLMLAIWSPFAFTNLRAQPLDQLFCSDASLHGGGVCSTPISRAATLELCRVSEQKGFYTRIDTSTLGKYMANHGSGITDSPEHVDEIPVPLSEGFIWDFVEVFRGSGHLSAAHAAAGFRVHPGFDIKDGAVGDVLRPSTFLAIIGLLVRRVVRFWHVAPVCTTFGTLRRPRLRSLLAPFGFDPGKPHTHIGNQFAMRGGFILWLCLCYNLVCSIEQPGGSVMYKLDIYTRLYDAGFLLTRFPFCGWGTPFQKLSSWISNNPHFAELAAKRVCGCAGKHLRIRGTFDRATLRKFNKSCRPSAEAVFGASPRLGQSVASFSAAYPLPLCDHVASLNLRLRRELDSVKAQTTQRPFSTPPKWVGELGTSLHWKKLLQYGFTKQNHININEHLSYRSLLKHLARYRAHSRFCALLDSRVVIGANAKGRSSSRQLNFYLGSTLPYVIGGDIYPYLLHIGSAHNASDDISRFVRLRQPSTHVPRWLRMLLAGDPTTFEQVQVADQLVWPLSGWSRLLRLSVLRACNP